MMYLIVENACTLNKQIAIDSGCDMTSTDRMYKCYGWGFEIDSLQWLPKQYHGQLLGFDHLTDEQQRDVKPPEEEI